MNDYTRYLCHKKSKNPASQKDVERYASGSSFDTTEPDKTTTSKIVESVTDFAKRKALANRLWYQKNKDWKHDYNADYYQANKEYWQRRYREALADRRQAHRLIDDQVNAYNRNVDMYNTNADAFDSISDPFFGNSATPRMSYFDPKEADRLKKTADISYDVIKENMERANKDYKWFMDNNKKMSFKEAWSAGASGIASAGKRFLAKLGIS